VRVQGHGPMRTRTPPSSVWRLNDATFTPSAWDPFVARRATLGSMSTEVTQRELRNNSGEIMRGLDEGRTFVVTRNGVPVGELAPLRRHRFVSAEAAVAIFAGAPGVELQRLRNDLDRVADQRLEPRG